MKNNKSIVGIMTDRIITEVGSSAIWDSFYKLLDEHFPSAAKTVPMVRKKLFKGKVKARDAEQAMREMMLVRDEFKSARREDGVSIYESLITSTGRNLVDELVDSFSFALETGCDVKIVKYNSPVDTAFL